MGDITHTQNAPPRAWACEPVMPLPTALMRAFTMSTAPPWHRSVSPSLRVMVRPEEVKGWPPRAESAARMKASRRSKVEALSSLSCDTSPVRVCACVYEDSA